MLTKNSALILQKIKKTILYLSIVSSLLLLCKSFNSGSLLLPIIPLFYGFCFKYLTPKNVIVGSGFSMLTIVEFIRYIIYPLLFDVSICKTGLGIFINEAILLMLFEVFVIHISIYFYYKNKRQRLQAIRLTHIPSFIPLIFFLIILISYLQYPLLFSNKHFILSPEFIRGEMIDTKISGVLNQFVRWGQIIVIAYFFYYFYKQYIAKRNIVCYYLSIAIILIPALFYSGASRLSILMPIVCAIFVLNKCYGSRVKKLTFSIICYGIIAIVSLSLMKTWGISKISDVSAQEELANSGGLLNAYFGGIKNVAIGLKAYSINGPSLEVLVNDCLRNTMGISDFFVEDPQNSVTIFNEAFYGHKISFLGDQICPTIIEGLLTFGPILCFLPTIIMVLIVCSLDYNWQRTTNIGYAYLFANMASLIGWCIPGNFMHLTTHIINCFIPVYLLMLFNAHLSKNKK